jgi:hypothetical protein
MATGQPNEPDHAGVSNPLHSVWWKWTAPKSGTVRVSTDGSSFDTTLAAYLLKPESGDRRSASLGKKIDSYSTATADTALRITLPGHGFAHGQIVEINRLSNHSVESARFLVSRIDDDSFYLSGTADMPQLRLSPESRVHPIK